MSRRAPYCALHRVNVPPSATLASAGFVFSEGVTAGSVAFHEQPVAVERNFVAGAVEDFDSAVVAFSFDIFREHEVGSHEGAVFFSIDGQHDAFKPGYAFPIGCER